MAFGHAFPVLGCSGQALACLTERSSIGNYHYLRSHQGILCGQTRASNSSVNRLVLASFNNPVT
jgi:hypothetical protein